MNSNLRLSVSRLLAIAAICVLAWPSVMAAAVPGTAGDQTAPQRLDFLFDKDAYGIPAAQPGATESQKLSRLSIRLYGGFSRVAAGDVNTGADGYFELFETYAALGMGTTTGGYRPVHAGYNFGADVIYQLSPGIGVGLGVGYLRSSSGSAMTFAGEGQAFALSGRPTLSAVPIRLGVFLTFPVAAKISLTADAGAAYYAGLKLDATQRLELDATNWLMMSLSGSRSGDIGFQGSFGFEYRLSRGLGLFAEALGRYARFKNFESVTSRSEVSGGGSETISGKLYILTETFPEGTFSVFTVEETPPVDNPPAETFREPKIDLSGFSLQAGIRIRF